MRFTVLGLNIFDSRAFDLNAEALGVVARYALMAVSSGKGNNLMAPCISSQVPIRNVVCYLSHLDLMLLRGKKTAGVLLTKTSA
jgi:hypothetical protein